MISLEKSRAAFSEAQTSCRAASTARSVPTAVSVPAAFYRPGQGSTITDIDGNEYIDYVGSWGPMIVGHAHPRVVKALQEAAERGTSYGAPTLVESDWPTRSPGLPRPSKNCAWSIPVRKRR